MKHAIWLIIMIVAAGCSNTQVGIDLTELDLDFDVPSFETAAQVEHALAHAVSSDRAIVFVHMDWAIMEPQRHRYIQFMLEYHRQSPRDHVGFHYIDCTPITSDYTPLKSLLGWPGSGRDIYAQQGTGGAGDVIWIEHGVVKHVETIFESVNAGELVNKTRQFFAAAENGT